MQALWFLFQAVSQNVALCCCALFAGGACYVSLVEQPTMLGGRNDLTPAYILLAQPRPGIYATTFAALGGLAGVVAGITASSLLWLGGGLLLLAAMLFQLGLVRAQTRIVLEMATAGEIHHAPLQGLARLHALQSLLGLGALFVFILAT